VRSSVSEYAIGPAQALPLQPGEPLRAMWCGRVSPEKRPQAFVEAVSRLGGGVTGDLFGDGVNRKALAAAAQGSGVTLHGAVPQAEVLAAMRAHHVFVSSSVGFDNQPMVMLEAIAAGLPVVYCDPDLAETLPPEGSLLAPTPDAAGIAAALRGLASDPVRLAGMAAATASARHMVSIDTHVERLVAAYEEAKQAPLRRA